MKGDILSDPFGITRKDSISPGTLLATMATLLGLNPAGFNSIEHNAAINFATKAGYHQVKIPQGIKGRIRLMRAQCFPLALYENGAAPSYTTNNEIFNIVNQDPNGDVGLFYGRYPGKGASRWGCLAYYMNLSPNSTTIRLNLQPYPHADWGDYYEWTISHANTLAMGTNVWAYCMRQKDACLAAKYMNGAGGPSTGRMEMNMTTKEVLAWKDEKVLWLKEGVLMQPGVYYIPLMWAWVVEEA